MKLIFLVALVLSALASSQAQPVVEIFWPRTNQVVGNQLNVLARVNETFEATAVAASLGGGAVPLSPSGRTHWSGSLYLAGLPSGSNTLQVLAVDGAGATLVTEIPIFLDKPPLLSVSGPTNGAFTTGMLPVQADCSDDLGDCEIEIFASGYRLGKSGAANLDLLPYDHSFVELVFVATDSRHQETRVRRTVLVESNPRLAPIPFPTLTQAPTNGLNTQMKHYDPSLGGQFFVLRTNDFVILDQVTGRPNTDMVSNSEPIWDGQQVVYIKRDAQKKFSVAAWRGAEIWKSQEMSVKPFFVSRNGWTAYVASENGHQFEIWVKPPGDRPVKRASFNEPSIVQAVNPSGQVVFSSGDLTWISSADNSLVNLGRYIGRTAWTNNQWMVITDGFAFSLNTTPAPHPTMTIARTPDHKLNVQSLSGSVMEVSEDLVNWTIINTNRLTDRTRLKQRFYRSKP